MKLHYYPETDSLYISLSDAVGADAREIADGVVLDFDADGRLVGIDIDHASKVVDLSRLEAEELPVGNLSLTGVGLHKMKKGLVHADPSVMMGKPVIAGTRITAELILEMLGAGQTIEQILDSYPSLTKDSIQATMAFAARVLQAEWATQREENR